MSVKTTKFVRKPFYVEAVQVTNENMDAVALWCGGDVRTSTPAHPADGTNPVRYIKVNVLRPMNERQTRAHVGDWVLSSGNNFKVYADKAFTGSFDVANETVPVFSGS